MTRQQLYNSILEKKTFLCVGLDSDYAKMPQCMLDFDDPLFEFNKRIIDSTFPYVIAYKPNVAFYECLGSKGWYSLEKTIQYIRQTDKSLFIIADAKRGDIGNTSNQYAKAFFETMDCDAVTVAPYMGKDSVSPFLQYDGKWVILLALTSNEGANDFQFINNGNEYLYETVIRTSAKWGGNPENMMFVVGATKANMLAKIRNIVPDNFLLVPGIGTQGGSLDDVCKYGLNKEYGLIVNSSRGIIFASKDSDFDKTAAVKSKELQIAMSKYIVL